uniref:Uncharacterized protein n=1 Tax=Anguilla anguilla TaxID=7936 RepID=A0A0E9SRV5_ANGAN
MEHLEKIHLANSFHYFSI